MIRRSAPNKISRKRAKYLRQTRAERRAVRERAGGRCEIQSPVCAPHFGMGFAHILSAAQGGKYDRANGLWACNPCNEWCASHPIEAAKLGLIIQRKTCGLAAHPGASESPLTPMSGKPMSRNGVGRSDTHGTVTSD